MFLAIETMADGDALLGFGATPEEAVLTLIGENPVLADYDYIDVIEGVPGKCIPYGDEATPGLMRFAVKDGKCVRVQEQYIKDVLHFRNHPGPN